MIALYVLAALAQTGSAPPAQNVTVTGPEERPVCRQSGPERSSATRISRRRLCLTQRQWRERELSNADGGDSAADTLETISHKIETPGHRPPG